MMKPKWWRIASWTCGSVVLLLGLAFLSARSREHSATRVLAQARRELARGEYARAEGLARQLLAQAPGDQWALLVAAEAAIRQNRSDAALEYYRRIPDDGSEASVAGLFGAGEVLSHQGRLTEAEQNLRRALRHDPHHQLSHYRLAFVLGITGRRWESVPHLLELLRNGRFTVENLVMLGDLEQVMNEEALLESSRLAAPDDPLPLLGQARLVLARNEAKAAGELLRQVLVVLPHETEAQVRMGLLLLDSGRPDDFLEWHARLPIGADEHPDLWVVRGRWLMEHSELRPAARCFWEAVLRNPDSRQANYRLGQILNELDQPDKAAPFLRRAKLIQQLSTVLDGLFHNQHDVASMERAVILTESLGRVWEAWAWARSALAEDSGLTWAQERVARLEPLLRPEMPRTLAEYNPARKVDLSSFPLPDWKAPNDFAAPRTPEVRTGAQVRFADVAAEAGINFAYFNSPDPSTPGARIFETTGGGVAAFDFDGDAWPDLYFTQGCRWPPHPGESEHRDRLYRNRGDGRAADVTETAGLGDAQFSQGISAGDFDNDGFQDLYLANLGRNRLYRNNGDGTFTDVTDAAGLHGDYWTTSCLIADLNGDAFPDLYDVTYCAGSSVFTLRCPNNGVLRTCSPRAFDPAPDQVHLNRGDGTFENVSASAGIDVPNGYGLGIVAADFEGTGQLNLFVANDETANFYFVNRTDRHDRKLKFTEQALASGLAFDADGLAQACMGVAAGDADGNGLLDLFVSNFFKESDTLYLQQPGGLFVDMTRPAGLRDPTFEPLGFGTQFLDGELNGLPDLVLTNGHIDDRRAIGEPYEMAPQYFRNAGGGRFVQVDAGPLGQFFEGKYLGRGLARLDWNRDGKEDFVVSHIGSPAALVVNRTDGAGHFLALRFRGVAGDRDAIGTTVRVTAGGRTSTSQLTAGDGYQASNERQIVVGLGNATQIDKVSVRWLSGIEQIFENVSGDALFIVIEGRNELIGVPAP
jgi:tetratricopeptide (TPR) repeat protein